MGVLKSGIQTLPLGSQAGEPRVWPTAQLPPPPTAPPLARGA